MESDDVVAASVEITLDERPHRIDWHPGEEGGRLVVRPEPPADGRAAATFAFAVFDGGEVHGHWLTRPAWIRRDELVAPVFEASRAMLAPFAEDEESPHGEAAAIGIEVLDDLLRDRRR